ncbi:hypothetical protein PG984_014639 [Apiospora sp. TS-2023a]
MQLIPTLNLMLAGLAASVVSAETTYLKKGRNDNTSLFTVTATNVSDVPGTCGGLWDNLHHSHLCESLEDSSCGETAPGQMKWMFRTYLFCNKGHVESAWWEATRHRFGAIECLTDCEGQPSSCNPWSRASNPQGIH